MKRVTVLVLAAAILAAFATSIASQQPKSPGTDQGLTRHRSGKPLEALVRPGERTLVVEKDQSPPLIVEPPPGVGQLEWLTSLSPVVLIVAVEQVLPRLTPKKDWVEATVYASVEDVLKSVPQTIAPGQAIRFRQDGGTIHIGATTIHAVLPWAESFHVGRRYLIFADPTSEEDVFAVEATTAALVTEADQALMPLARKGKATTARGVPIETAIERIRRAANK
jgi:hypothetical protein